MNWWVIIWLLYRVYVWLISEVSFFVIHKLTIQRTRNTCYQWRTEIKSIAYSQPMNMIHTRSSRMSRSVTCTMVDNKKYQNQISLHNSWFTDRCKLQETLRWAERMRRRLCLLIRLAIGNKEKKRLKTWMVCYVYEYWLGAYDH